MDWSTSRCFSGEDHFTVVYERGWVASARERLSTSALDALHTQLQVNLYTDLSKVAAGVCDVLLIHHPLLQVRARSPPCIPVCRTSSPASSTLTHTSRTPSRACKQTWQWHAPTACSMLTCTRPPVRSAVRHPLCVRRPPMARSFRLGRDVTVGAGVRLRRALPYRNSTFVRSCIALVVYVCETATLRDMNVSAPAHVSLVPMRSKYIMHHSKCLVMHWRRRSRANNVKRC